MNINHPEEGLLVLLFRCVIETSALNTDQIPSTSRMVPFCWQGAHDVVVEICTL